DLTDHWAHSRELRAPAPIRELRDLTRYRKVLIQAMSVLTENKVAASDAGISRGSEPARCKTAQGIAHLATNGAEGGNRTHTPSGVHDFESCASASSATSALALPLSTPRIAHPRGGRRRVYRRRRGPISGPASRSSPSFSQEAHPWPLR